jgi:chemotaxis protein histidine kinase CheA
MTDTVANILDFDAEKTRRIMAEATRLAGLAPAEWRIWIDRSAENLGGVPRKTLEALVVDIIKANDKKAAREEHKRRYELALQVTAKRLEEDRAAKERAEAAAQERREHDRECKEKARTKRESDKAEKDAAKRQAAAEKAAEQKAEREKRKAEKEIERKAKDKTKTFGAIMRLPTARHDKELQRLAERLGEDTAALRDEFAEFLGIGAVEKTEPWPESVDTAAVLQECSDKIRRYVAQQEHQQTAAVLWAAHCWLYDHNVPTYSPILAPTSAEPDSGKTTLVAVVGRTAPRFSLNVEMTGPSLYRYVDAVKPTLVIDEADDLFARKSDLKHIVNAGWTRGATIQRQVNINGVWMTVDFDLFTPKAIALLGRNLPPATRTRSIELRMQPKRADEEVDEFQHVDDAEFAVLRRKFARWAADNAPALKQAKPALPVGFNTRAAMNWKLLLAIAELAGGDWPERAREAAERLTRKGRLPSDGVKLLAAIKTMFAESGKKVIASKTIIAELVKNPTDIWVAYNHGGAVTQRQVAHLLSAYDGISRDTCPTIHTSTHCRTNRDGRPIPLEKSIASPTPLIVRNAHFIGIFRHPTDSYRCNK